MQLFSFCALSVLYGVAFKGTTLARVHYPIHAFLFLFSLFVSLVSLTDLLFQKEFINFLWCLLCFFSSFPIFFSSYDFQKKLVLNGVP